MVQWSKLVDLTRHLPHWNVQTFPPMSLSSVIDPTLDPLLGILALLFPCFVQPLKVPPSLYISYESNTLRGAGALFYRWSLNLSGAFELWLTWSVPSRNPVEWPCAPLYPPHPVRGCDVNISITCIRSFCQVHSFSLQSIYILGRCTDTVQNLFLSNFSPLILPVDLSCNNYSWPWTTQVWTA